MACPVESLRRQSDAGGAGLTHLPSRELDGWIVTRDEEIDRIVAGMKRSAMDAEYMRRLREIIGTISPDSGVFNRAIETSSMRLAAMACARQGFDAGRFTTGPAACPYPMGVSVLDTFRRRAWFVGFAQGRKVIPRPEPRTFNHHPVVIRLHPAAQPDP